VIWAGPDIALGGIANASSAMTNTSGTIAIAGIALLVVAGIGAGLCGSVAGLASLMSYPALLAVGLPPISANVTNTVSLIFSSVGTAAGSRPELRGQGVRLRHLGVIALVGGCLGGALVLVTPAHAFRFVVPWLIGLGSVAVLLPRRRQRAPSPLPQPQPVPLVDNPHASTSEIDHLPRDSGAADGLGTKVGVFLVAIYGGYFGAAAGVLLLALLLASTDDTVPRANALKNILLGVANSIAAVIFVFFSSVHWTAALPLAAGVLVGSRLGPPVVRVVPQMLLRSLIAVAGLGLAAYLAVTS